MRHPEGSDFEEKMRDNLSHLAISENMLPQTQLSVSLWDGSMKLYPCAVQGVNLQWVRVPPGNWSLQPVAVGAVEGGNDFC